MAVIEFSSSPLYNVDRSHCWTSQHCLVGVEEGYGLKKGSSYVHINV